MFRAQKVGNDIYGVKSNWKLESSLGDTAETGFRHNVHYHQYFHGYTEVRVEKPNGKYSIQRIYTEDWYVQKLTKSQWLQVKVLMLILVLFAAFSYCFAMTRSGFEGNLSRIVAIPGFISVILLFLLVASTIGFVSLKRKMTWWEQYSSTNRVDKFSLFASVMLLMTAILIGLNCFFGVESVLKELLLASGVLLSALCTFLMYLINKKIDYFTEKNCAILPEGEKHLIL
ncbi:MAG: hypothetical protein J6P79_14565 [Pseudobutyrivibrio sp.]|nr:hypothetical protein [Pseudobutyrivibrio sp.]